MIRELINVNIILNYYLTNSINNNFFFFIARVGLMHIGVFILLLLSGERNFGVRLNKPYTATVPMDIPVFTGSHADLLITVFHKIIATGHQRLQPLFDCLLTILVNGAKTNTIFLYFFFIKFGTFILVSPYLKTLSMVAAIKLLHLLEAFSTPWFLFSSPSNHHLVFFLLEIFNNIIQYQFDGNSNLVYTIIRKRHVFHALANLPSDLHGISKCLNNRKGIRASRIVLPPAEQQPHTENIAPCAIQKSVDIEGESSDGDCKSDIGESSMEGSKPAQPAEPGTLKVSLLDTPAIGQMTERESAHHNAVAEHFAEFEECSGETLTINELDEATAAVAVKTIESV